MIEKNGWNWKTEVGSKCENSKLNSVTGSVGAVSTFSARPRDDTISIGRANGNEETTATLDSGDRNSGGMARQLITQVERQLAYHKEQVSELETRLNQLNQFTEELDTEQYQALE